MSNLLIPIILTRLFGINFFTAKMTFKNQLEQLNSYNYDFNQTLQFEATAPWYKPKHLFPEEYDNENALLPMVFDPVAQQYVGWQCDTYHRLHHISTYENLMNLKKRINNGEGIRSMNELHEYFQHAPIGEWVNPRHALVLSDKMRTNPDAMQYFIDRQASWAIQYMADNIQNTPYFAQKILEIDPTNVMIIRQQHLDDFQIVRKLVEHDKYKQMIRYASDRMKNNIKLFKKGVQDPFDSNEPEGSDVAWFGEHIRDNEQMIAFAYIRSHEYKYSIYYPYSITNYFKNIIFPRGFKDLIKKASKRIQQKYYHGNIFGFLKFTFSKFYIDELTEYLNDKNEYYQKKKETLLQEQILNQQEDIFKKNA